MENSLGSGAAPRRRRRRHHLYHSFIVVVVASTSLAKRKQTKPLLVCLFNSGDPVPFHSISVSLLYPGGTLFVSLYFGVLVCSGVLLLYSGVFFHSILALCFLPVSSPPIAEH